MAGMTLKNGVLVGVIAVLALYVVYQYDNSLFGLMGRREGFAAGATENVQGAQPSAMQPTATPAAATPTATTPMATTTATTGGSTMNTPMTTDTTSNATAKKEKFMSYGGPKTVTGFKGNKEGFADLASMEGPAAFASAEAPAGCYPRDQLTPVELLPADQNSIYAQQNPMGTGSLKGKNFLSAGALIGVNTVGQSLRNANLQLRSEPPNPQVPVSIFAQSTIGPDISHRPLEVGS